MFDAVAHVITGWSFIAAGLIAAGRRSSSRTPMLMVLLGFAWFAPTVWYFETSLTLTLGHLFQGFQWLVLAYLFITFPTGRVSTRLERFTAALIYVYVIPTALGTLPFDEARDCAECRANLLSIHPDPGLADAVQLALNAWVFVLLPFTLTVIVQRWRRAGASARRAYTPVFATAIVPVIVLAVGIGRGLSTGEALPDALPRWAFELPFLSLACGLLIGLLRSWLDRSAVGKLVVELGAASTPDRLREALARALHDPTVELLYWDSARSAYVNGDGKTCQLPASTPNRTVTRLGHSESVGALVHDPVLREDPQLIEAVGEAARLALENERMQAEIRAQLEELRASRQRIAEAALAERQRVERDLHDGAQQRLVMLSLEVAMAQERANATDDPELREMLEKVADELSGALVEIRELARGIHPALLTEAGLGPALQSLAERAPVPTRVAAAPAARFPASVEATAYFVVSECLTNIAKHSRASMATISAREQGDELVLEVLDDGVGGAQMANGSGLAGLKDRVTALGGRLTIESARDSGTTVKASIPCG